jgi:hypothetical protein
METAALLLRLLLALDQAVAAVVVLVSVHTSFGRRVQQPPQEDHTIRTGCLRPQASQDVLGRFV